MIRPEVLAMAGSDDEREGWVDVYEREGEFKRRVMMLPKNNIEEPVPSAKSGRERVKGHKCDDVS